MKRKLLVTAVRSALIAGAAVATATATAPPAIAAEDAPRRTVELVLALDVSGSMDGLIESAKQRLWDVTNELARARPVPNLRVALLTYGSPAYGEQTGYVRVDVPFTSDLDAVSERLFSFRTNGGDEYVARVIHTSLDTLQWTTDADALRVIFVAGNESAEQDPRIGLEQAVAAAVERGIAVNTIYCGPAGDGIAAAWQRVAYGTNGLYAAIDQNAAAVAHIATPLDDDLAALNDRLNATYVAFGGQRGQQGQQRQVMQDRNAAAMSPQAAAARAATKAGGLYSAAWDLVDAVADGAELANIAEADLPPEMQSMSSAQRVEYVAAKAEQRAALEAEIGLLAAERSAFIEQERRERAGNVAAGAAGAAGEQPEGLDAALTRGIREAAEAKGFSFAEN